VHAGGSAADWKAMSLLTQLLGGLISQREGSVQHGPAIWDELSDAAHGPSGLELGDKVEQVDAEVNPGVSAGLHERVGSGEALCGGGGTREQVVIAADAWFADGALGVAVVDLESPVGEATSNEGALLSGVAKRAGERGLRGALGLGLVDPFMFTACHGTTRARSPSGQGAIARSERPQPEGADGWCAMRAQSTPNAVAVPGATAAQAAHHTRVTNASSFPIALNSTS
jgi:hypothetical protein